MSGKLLYYDTKLKVDWAVLKRKIKKCERNLENIWG
jgi:hypothetical protein